MGYFLSRSALASLRMSVWKRIEFAIGVADDAVLGVRACNRLLAGIFMSLSPQGPGESPAAAQKGCPTTLAKLSGIAHEPVRHIFTQPGRLIVPRLLCAWFIIGAEPPGGLVR